MRIYKTRKLIDGKVLGSSLAGVEILAINYRKVQGNDMVEITVEYTGKKLYINPSVNKPIRQIEFNDKFIVGRKYTLNYYKAQDLENKQMELF